MRYTKQAISLAGQIEILRKRGLIIDDETECLKVLNRISYFRMAGYWRPLEKDKSVHIFKPNSHFHSVVLLYQFDLELKILIFSAIQQIEIAVRTKMIQHIAMKHGPFWFIDIHLSKNNSTFTTCINNLRKELKRSYDEFIKEHFQKYDEPDFPPAWKTLEVASFGTLSKLFQNLNDNKIKKKIAHDFNIPTADCMESWLQSLTIIRNACAHHARLWNAHIPITPQIACKMRGDWIVHLDFPQTRLYSFICTIAYWLNAIDDKNTFRQDLKTLIVKYPSVDIRAMGFHKDWQEESLWHNNNSKNQPSTQTAYSVWSKILKWLHF